MANKLYLTWRDRTGEAMTVALNVLVTLTDPHNVLVQALRNAGVLILKAVSSRAAINITQTETDTVGISAYESTTDKAHFTFLDTNGVSHTFAIPGPNEGLFDEDNEYVKPDSIGSNGYIQAVLDFTVTAEGGAWEAFSGGTRSMRE